MDTVSMVLLCVRTPRCLPRVQTDGSNGVQSCGVVRQLSGVESEGITESCVKAERRKLRGAGYVCTEVVVDTVYMEFFSG